ncbi:MAG TPA: P22 phage major capsid protein family protein [Burkholderiaceae bacterium]|nr:P22 phage major capsid protein family protein [Burkholderiaceae bacterium]
MSNTLVTCSIVAKEALAVLENMLTFSAKVNRNYENEYSSNQSRGYSPGQTISIKRPPRYTFRSGRVASPQATVETTTNLTLNQGGVDINFTSIERTLSLQQLNQKLQAAMATIANRIDLDGLSLVRTAVGNAVGTVGTLPATQAAATDLILSAGQRLDEMAAPKADRHFVSAPDMNRALVSGMAGLFNSSAAIGQAYRSGVVSDPFGFDFTVDQNVSRHTNGTQATTGVTVNGAGQSGSTINVNSASVTGTILAGSVITFAGVFAVNPQSRQSTGQLAQFVVTADVAASATSIPISPALTPSGAFQNVTASPANTAAVTILGAANASYNNSVAFHRDAFTLATVPLYMPQGGRGVIDAAQESYKGFNMRVIEFYDGVNDNYVMRFDVLYGWAATYPELAVKVVA